MSSTDPLSWTEEGWMSPPPLLTMASSQGYPTTILMSGPPQPLAPQPLTYVGVYPSQQSPYLTNPDPLSPTMLQSPQVQNQSQRNLNHVNIWNGNGGGSPHMLSNGAGSSHMLGPNGCSDGKDAFLCSPGPPIRSSDRFKGPKGANLFVFHLPNEMTNWDLYLLFRRHGTILSVHIMINKGTGLSRGFGFVSFSSSDEAQLAIDEMDGYRVGKKRLKVQRKRFNDDGTPNDCPSDACLGISAGKISSHNGISRLSLDSLSLPSNEMANVPHNYSAFVIAGGHGNLPRVGACEPSAMVCQPPAEASQVIPGPGLGAGDESEEGRRVRKTPQAGVSAVPAGYRPDASALPSSTGAPQATQVTQVVQVTQVAQATDGQQTSTENPSDTTCSLASVRSENSSLRSSESGSGYASSASSCGSDTRPAQSNVSDTVPQHTNATEGGEEEPSGLGH